MNLNDAAKEHLGIPIGKTGLPEKPPIARVTITDTLTKFLLHKLSFVNDTTRMIMEAIPDLKGPIQDLELVSNHDDVLYTMRQVNVTVAVTLLWHHGVVDHSKGFGK